MSNWIKVMDTLPRSQSVFALARVLKCKRHAALGLAIDWLCWLDENSTNGETGLKNEEISEILGEKKAAAALEAVGWIEHDAAGFVVAVDFDKHNGISAKRRAETARRVARHQAKTNAKSVSCLTPDALADKIRVDKNIQNPPSIHSEGSNEEAGRACAAAAMTPAAERGEDAAGLRPAGPGEVDAYLAAQAVLRLMPADRQKCAMAFFDEAEAVGWINRHGYPLKDWRAAARRYAARWAENLHTPFRNGVQAARPSRNTGTANEGRGGDYDIR